MVAMHPPPFGDDVIKVFKNNLPDLANIARGHIVGKSLANIKRFRVDPILALPLRFIRMDVHRFIALVRVKMKPPAIEQENRRPGRIASFVPPFQFAVTLTLSM